MDAQSPLFVHRPVYYLAINLSERQLKPGQHLKGLYQAILQQTQAHFCSIYYQFRDTPTVQDLVSKCRHLPLVSNYKCHPTAQYSTLPIWFQYSMSTRRCHSTDRLFSCPIYPSAASLSYAPSMHQLLTPLTHHTYRNVTSNKIAQQEATLKLHYKLVRLPRYLEPIRYTRRTALKKHLSSGRQKSLDFCLLKS